MISVVKTDPLTRPPLRSATLSRSGAGAAWCVSLVDPQARWGSRPSTTLGGDPWDALHWTCDWIITGTY